MLKKIEISEPTFETERNWKEEDLYIVTKYRIISCTDFNDKTKEIKEILSVREEKISDANKIKSLTEEKYLETDCIRWYDIATLSLTWWFRTKYKYEVKEKDVHKIGNKEIDKQKGLPYEIWKCEKNDN